MNHYKINLNHISLQDLDEVQERLIGEVRATNTNQNGVPIRELQLIPSYAPERVIEAINFMRNELIAKDILARIQTKIVNKAIAKEWKIHGIFGGNSIKYYQNGVQNPPLTLRLTKTVKRVMDEIKDANSNTKSYTQALGEVVKVFTKAKNSTSFFRDPSSQSFYDKCSNELQKTNEVVRQDLCTGAFLGS